MTRKRRRRRISPKAKEIQPGDLERLKAKAEKDMAKNKALIEAGETFRARNKPTYKRRSTSDLGRRRHGD